MKVSTNRFMGVAGVVLGLLCTDRAPAQAVIEKEEIRFVDHVYQILDKDMVKISFDDNAAVLSDSALTGISSFVKETKDEAKVERYLVASWSDADYPVKGQLSKGQKKLALERSEHIKKALGAAGANHIDTFEMTSQPNWIQRAFSTDTAEIKDKGLNMTNDEKLLKEIGKRLREKGGPRTAVIVAKFKNEVILK